MTSATRTRLVVLASGGGTNLQAIIDACSDDTIHASVVAVVSDRPSTGALHRAQVADIPALHLNPKLAADRRSYDESLGALVADHQPDYVVLAGWMRVLSTAFLNRFPEQVVNLHPALPGELPGLNAIRRAFEEFTDGRRRMSGVMVHLVPDELVDAGPVLGARSVAFRESDTLETFEQRMHEAEHTLLVETLAELCSPTASPSTASMASPSNPSTSPSTTSIASPSIASPSIASPSIASPSIASPSIATEATR